ncbi:MAG: M20/M25/M40 family metallo-hydrolase [Deltaproteobacteria bacterium]|nr:M20/M25/M40 family metallo-hydrolase [Deltaproteobacteria bacterium]
MKKILIVFLFSFCSQNVFSLSQPDTSLIKKHVQYLADDALEGRGLGTYGFWKAASYIAEEFSKSQLQTSFQNFFIPVSFKSGSHAIIKIPTANVVGMLPANNKDLEKNYTVLGAHFDHLGFGDAGSLDPDGTVHNGADDNASGVAVLIEAARLWSQASEPHGNIIFVAFAGEEMGLLGSSYFVNHPPFDLSQTFAMFNFDMVGRLREKTLTVFGSGTALEWNTILSGASNDNGLFLTKHLSGIAPSDSTSFYLQDIPVLFLNTGSHEDYHKPSDDLDKINFDGMSYIVHFFNDILASVTSRHEKLSFQKTKDPKDPGRGSMPYFGSIPDYSYEGKGLRLSGVQADSPASKAGLQSKDIIVQFGTFIIEDIYNYTDALRAYKAGDEVLILYMRDNQQHETKAILEAHPSLSNN